MSLTSNILKKLFKKIVKSKRKTWLLYWESNNSLLECQKVSARWVPQKLIDEMKAERIKSFKGNSEEEGEGFLQQIVRGDKT